MSRILSRRLLFPAGASALAGLGMFVSSWASEGVIGRGAQEAPIVIGQLTCSVIGETEAEAGAVAQGRDVSCQFRPGLSGVEETYTGTLQGTGRVAALFDRGTVMLVVKQFGSNTVMPGMLAQTYAADAAARAGRSAPLVGDKDSAVVLQPMIEREAGDGGTPGNIPDALIVLVELKLQASSA